MPKTRCAGLWLPLTFVGILLFLLSILAGCTGPAPTPTATPAPTATPTLPPIGMAFDQRYHTVHVTKLGLQCTVCHAKTTPTYQDPLAQVFNLADRRACLACHKEGTTQPFYGEEWQKASVK